MVFQMWTMGHFFHIFKLNLEISQSFVSKGHTLFFGEGRGASEDGVRGQSAAALVLLLESQLGDALDVLGGFRPGPSL